MARIFLLDDGSIYMLIPCIDSPSCWSGGEVMKCSRTGKEFLDQSPFLSDLIQFFEICLHAIFVKVAWDAIALFPVFLQIIAPILLGKLVVYLVELL